MGRYEHARRQWVDLLVVAFLAAIFSPSSQADERRTWGDVAGRRLDLQASAGVPLMTFQYGDAPDELPLRFGDDPDETVVGAFQVEEDESAWIVTVAYPGCDTLRHFVALSGRAVHDRGVSVPCCCRGFMVRPEGVYLGALKGRPEAQFSLLTPEGVLRHLSLVRSWGGEGRKLSSVGVLREVGGAHYACLSGDCVRIGSRTSPDTLDGKDFLGGVPARQGEPIWQSGRFIMRGGTPILDLGENDHRFLWDVFDGGFVIGRVNVYAGGTPARAVELFDENGNPLRSLVIPTPAGQYGIGEGGNFFFTEKHVYYLELDRRAAVLLRY